MTNLADLKLALKIAHDWKLSCNISLDPDGKKLRITCWTAWQNNRRMIGTYSENDADTLDDLFDRIIKRQEM